MNNTFYNLSRKELDSALVSHKITLREALRVVERYEPPSADKIESLIWSMTLRAHLIIEEHC